MKRLLDNADDLLRIAGDGAKPIYEALRAVQEWYMGAAQCRGVKFHRGWWVPVGDVKFCHADRSTKNPETTVRNLVEYFLDRQEGPHPFNVLINAHLHKHAETKAYGVRCITLPAQTRRHDYMADAKAHHGKLDCGWMILVIRKGRFVYNESRVYEVER